MYFLALFFIKILKSLSKILVIIQRSNGDVLLSTSLVKLLYESFDHPEIDLLVNDDTLEIAKIIPFVNNIHIFSYGDKKINRWNQEKNITLKIFKKYDLSINLTASDRSVLYALLASKKSISAVEINKKKSWWKIILLSHHYYFDTKKHILLNNLESLNILKIAHEPIFETLIASELSIKKIKRKLEKLNIQDFIIFHPSAQYNYKIYPQLLRNRLLNNLNSLGVPVLISGGKSQIDLDMKQELPNLQNLYDFIGETTLNEFIALSHLSLAYIGMDTLNMHIAASQNKRIFAIFGSTKLSMWSPWSNKLKTSTFINKPVQTYGENTIFQPSLPCHFCGVFGCGNNHGVNEFPYNIEPEDIFKEIENWYQNLNVSF